jgi:hypothetical protein
MKDQVSHPYTITDNCSFAYFNLSHSQTVDRKIKEFEPHNIKHSKSLIYSGFLRECNLFVWSFTLLYLSHSVDFLSNIYITILSILETIHEDKTFPVTYFLTNAVKIKGKVVPTDFMKAYGGSGVIVRLIDLALDGASCQIQAPAALSPKKEPPLPIE